MAHEVTLIPGDGTGPELTEATRRVLEATGVALEWDVQEAGADVMDQYGGNPLPDHVLDSIKRTGVALKGPITTPVGGGFRSVNVTLRKTLDLYGQVRPCKSYPGVRSHYENVDLIIVREATEDLYAGIEYEEGSSHAEELAEWIEGTIQFDMGLVRYYREHHGVNTFLRSTKVDEMGGLPKQAYYDGIHEITDDEALILETPLPSECRYWQALVADDRFCTVDWVNRQSSLNDAQAHVDADGWFRAVISKRDPGVPNWLDKADYPWGIIQMRWNRANEYPDPTIKKVPVAEVRDHLPGDTPVVTADERREQLRRRREGAQLRRIW